MVNYSEGVIDKEGKKKYSDSVENARKKSHLITQTTEMKLKRPYGGMRLPKRQHLKRKAIQRRLERK